MSKSSAKRFPDDREEPRAAVKRSSDTGHRVGWLEKYFIRPLVSSRNPPWFDARGVAVGLVIGLGVPLGAQMICLGLLRLVLRFNFLLAFACTWINNPLSVIPMYYGYYCLGSWLMGQPVLIDVHDFENIMKPLIRADYFWESVRAFLYLGLEILIRWSVAALLVAAVAGVVGYVCSYHAQKARCMRRAKKMGISYSKLLQQLEEPMRKG